MHAVGATRTYQPLELLKIMVNLNELSVSLASNLVSSNFITSRDRLEYLHVIHDVGLIQYLGFA